VIVSVAHLCTPKNRSPLWMVHGSFYPCLLFLIAWVWSLSLQLCLQITDRFYLLSGKRLKGSLGWSWKGFSWCLRSLNSSMASLFSHFNTLLNLHIRNSRVLPFSLIVIIFVLDLYPFLFLCSLEWSYFACISNRLLSLLAIIGSTLLA
jgi:hypothetical protein